MLDGADAATHQCPVEGSAELAGQKIEDGVPARGSLLHRLDRQLAPTPVCDKQQKI